MPDLPPELLSDEELIQYIREALKELEEQDNSEPLPDEQVDTLEWLEHLLSILEERARRHGI